MIKINISILLVLICITTSCSTYNNISKCSVPFENRGEITLCRSAVENGLQLSLKTSDPIALRTLLMQGFQLYLYGIKTDTTIIEIPSAKDVSNKIDHHPGEVKATLQGEKEKRPDMRPLVAALNKLHVIVTKKGLHPVSLQEEFEVSINPSNGMLSYSVIVPYNYFIDDGNVVTLLSQPDADMVETGEFSGQRYTNRSTEHRPQPFGVNEKDGNAEHHKTIKIQFNFNK